ncbi:hypothetical protein [Xanthomonas albilineans]|uniref:hypothetical protein n=1 Tax=Xanthomonas albilineans TaxID=29447 RepID=UPI0011B038D8|nr:hypothetical protein [Xanthomonas albilineans]
MALLLGRRSGCSCRRWIDWLRLIRVDASISKTKAKAGIIPLLLYYLNKSRVNIVNIPRDLRVFFYMLAIPAMFFIISGITINRGGVVHLVLGLIIAFAALSILVGLIIHLFVEFRKAKS